jgi:uncharacterized OB-fold protein
MQGSPAVAGVFEPVGSDGRTHLLVSRCPCGARRFPPRERCEACGQPISTMEEAAAAGTIYSWTTQPGTEPPRVVALVELDDGLRVQGFVEAAADEVGIGQRVRTVTVPFAERSGEFVSYAFALEEGMEG